MSLTRGGCQANERCIDLESVGQELIEDNIVSVSRQMIDKEASVAKTKPEANGHQNGAMDVDEEL